ncbi:hypothetical protein BDW67DRAFT_138855 [Aspergillus spinulosporus]
MQKSFVESLNAEPSTRASYCRLVESGTVLATSDTAAHAPHRHSQAPYRLRLYCFTSLSSSTTSLPPTFFRISSALFLLFHLFLPSHVRCILSSWVVFAPLAQPCLSCLPFIAITLGIFSRALFLYNSILRILASTAIVCFFYFRFP